MSSEKRETSGKFSSGAEAEDATWRSPNLFITNRNLPLTFSYHSDDCSFLRKSEARRNCQPLRPGNPQRFRANFHVFKKVFSTGVATVNNPHGDFTTSDAWPSECPNLSLSDAGTHHRACFSGSEGDIGTEQSFWRGRIFFSSPLQRPKAASLLSLQVCLC